MPCGVANPWEAPANAAAGWPGLEPLREGPVDVQAVLLLNHRELLGFIHWMGCQDVAESRPTSISMKLGCVLTDRVFAKTLQTRPP